MQSNGATPPNSPLRVTRAARKVFGGVSDGPLDPALREFVTDLVRPYGNPLREDLLTGPHGHAYATMAEELMSTLVSAEHPVDLLVLASAIHDTQLARPSSTYLSHICPGNPMAFAICDQGIAGAHTALRLVRDYAAAGDSRRALLVVAEQPTLHYEPSVVDGPPAPIPDRPAAVALLCEPGEGAGVPAFRQHDHVPPGEVAALLAADVAALAAGRPDVTLVLGAGLADAAVPQDVDRVVAAPSGQQFTGVWWELAGALADPSHSGLVLLADYDPPLRYLCVTAVDLAHAPTPVGAGSRSAAAPPAGEPHD